MASQQKTVDFIVEQLAEAGEVKARKLFGEYGLYLDGKLFALICNDTLFMKITPAGRALAGDLQLAAPYPGARWSFLVPGDRLDDQEWLTTLVRTTVDNLPTPDRR